MYSGKLWCRRCDECSNFEFSSIEDMPEVCPKCGDKDIYYNEIDWGNDNPPTEIKLGAGGCGGYRRHPNINDSIY